MSHDLRLIFGQHRDFTMDSQLFAVYTAQLPIPYFGENDGGKMDSFSTRKSYITYWKIYERKLYHSLCKQYNTRSLSYGHVITAEENLLIFIPCDLNTI